MNKKGFTLIELLVVIAVLGILASVVLVAINPTKRMQEARGAGKKNDVGQVALAVEACYTKNEGVYGGTGKIDCSDESATGALYTNGFLKRVPSGVTVCDIAGGEVMVYATLEATGNYWVYLSSTGASSETTTATLPATCTAGS
ncbi:MAG: type II secretion system protein [Candidatus Cloacimonetes bacterium]|nr:type II secretion system protein [Candidatus Cloacimonadota bacterium]